MNKNNNLKEIKIAGIQPIEIRIYYKFEELKKDEEKFTIGILKVSGVYPSGSKGAKIGEFLRGVSAFFREYFCVDAMILDLSELDYKWGNNLIGIVSPRMLKTQDEEMWFGYYIVASEKNKKELESLFLDFAKTSGIKKIYTRYKVAYK